MKDVVFWDLTQRGSCKNRSFLGTYQGDKIGELGTMLAVASNRSTLQHANVIPSSPILVTLMMEAICS
jgi:hypothetical protein